MDRTPLDANRMRLEELKKRREDRMKQMTPNQPSNFQNTKTVFNHDKRQFSVQRSEGIQLPRCNKETYERQVQCILETRSLDSKKRQKQQQAEQSKNVNLLIPKQNRRRKDQYNQNQQRQIICNIFPNIELNQQQVKNLEKSQYFNNFINNSSKIVQDLLINQEDDMIEKYLRVKMNRKQKQISNNEKRQNDILTHSLSFYDKNYTCNRVVTDFDWSSQISELFLASYSQNNQGNIKDHVGVVLLWSLSLKSRPQFYCFCQSQVTTAKFFPFSTNTVLGGCYNGQLLMWDVRVKSMPIQRSGISADAHKYPVNSLNIIGTQIANNIVSVSNDGMMCVWDIKQFNKPIKINRLSSTRSTRLAKNNSTSIGLRKNAELGSGIIDKNKDDIYDINITCCQFPIADANNYYVGSLNGVMYKNALHNKPTDKPIMYDQHNGPISAISVNNPSSEYQALSGLLLTSSFDWTVKLWSPNSTDSIRTFQSSEDYIYDVSWNPINPSLFTTVNNQGYIDLFDLTKDLQLPITHKKVDSIAQNRCKWSKEGSAILTGDTIGKVNLFSLHQNYRKLDHSKLDDFQNVIFQVKNKYN